MEVTVVLPVLSLVVSVGAVIVGYVTARRYGDMAAVKATRKFHEEDVARARVAALQSLKNEVARIRKLDEYYRHWLGTEAGGYATPGMPVAAFEMAFVSGSPGLTASSELLDAVCDYLIRADSVNSAIDRWLYRGGPLSAIEDAWNPIAMPVLSEILDRLDNELERELEEAQRRLG